MPIFFQKALEDEQFIKESKDKLKDIIVGGVKTTVITTAGLYNAAVGVYATAIDFLATNFFESEIDILLKQMSVYNNVIDWGGKLIKIDIYEDNRYTSTSNIYDVEGRRTEVSWYDKNNKAGDVYTLYGEKYMWGKLELLRNKPMDKLKESVNNCKMGIKDMEDIIKAYDF